MKSAYTMTEADVMAIESQIEQMENSQATMQGSAQSEYLIQCVDGVWRLVECRSVSNDGCDCCSQCVYYDVLTREVIS